MTLFYLRPYTPNWDQWVSYGMEFECLVPNNVRLEQLLRDVLRPFGHKIYSTNYTDRRQYNNRWKIKRDASVRTANADYRAGNGYEVITPVLYGHIDRTPVKAVLDAMLQAKCAVNSSCGLHTHLGIPSFFSFVESEHDENATPVPVILKNRRMRFDDLGETNVHNLLQWLVDATQEFEACFDMIVPYSRRRSREDYCQSIRQSRSASHYRNSIHNLSHTNILISTSRRRKWNYSNVRSLGTVEMRQFNGTLDYEKVASWVWLVSRFVHKAFSTKLRAANRTRRFIDLIAFLRADRDGWGRDERTKQFVQYLRRRAKLFAQFESPEGDWGASHKWQSMD